ncbi:hypothetical protein GCM10009080_03080 [Cupriavidus pauculus]
MMESTSLSVNKLVDSIHDLHGKPVEVVGLLTFEFETAALPVERLDHVWVRKYATERAGTFAMEREARQNYWNRLRPTRAGWMRALRWMGV